MEIRLRITSETLSEEDATTSSSQCFSSSETRMHTGFLYEGRGVIIRLGSLYISIPFVMRFVIRLVIQAAGFPGIRKPVTTNGKCQYRITSDNRA